MGLKMKVTELPPSLVIHRILKSTVPFVMVAYLYVGPPKAAKIA